jgi:hypothetical protein
MLVRTERVQGMRTQRVLHQTPGPPDVHDRDDRPVGVVLDRDRTGVAAVAIHEVGKRDGSFVANPVGPVDVDHPREVPLLRPELGRVRELPEQMRNDLVAVEPPTLAPEPEMLLRDVLREDARVVAEPVDGSGAARRTVLAQAGRSCVTVG